MYRIINENIGHILTTIPEQHVSEYLWLTNNPNPQENKYQNRYCKFWAMNGLATSRNYRQSYFARFDKVLQNRSSIPDLMATDWQIDQDRRSLQFSFSTKLIHMIDHSRPVYDSKIAAFYFFDSPTGRNITARHGRLMDFYAFLQKEYTRIQNNGLLNPAIEAFRKQFEQQEGIGNLHAVKIIDTLIWSYTSWMNNDKLVRQEDWAVYQ